MDVLDSKEAYEDSSIDNDVASLDEEYGSGLVGSGVTEEVEDMQKGLKSSSCYYYMLKPSHLLTQGFEKNRTSQKKLLKHMCTFGVWSEWREGSFVVSSYLVIETTEDQFPILNPMPL